MSTTERLAALRRTNPFLFWVWRHVVALFAHCGCRDAAALHRIVEGID